MMDEVEERARDIIYAENHGRTDRTAKSEQGYHGVASDHAFCGRREDGVFVRFSSTSASGNWREFARKGLRASRIDIQCTACGPGDCPLLAYEIRYGKRLPTRNGGKPVKLEFYSREDGGDTLYIGSAKSDRRGRLYDKGRESLLAYPLGAWRYEVQHRHGFADRLSNALVGRVEVKPWIAAYTANYFESQGVAVTFGKTESSWRDTYRKEQTTFSRQFEYLGTSIAPMIDRLKAHYTVRQLREQLGLQYNRTECQTYR